MTVPFPHHPEQCIPFGILTFHQKNLLNKCSVAQNHTDVLNKDNNRLEPSHIVQAKTADAFMKAVNYRDYAPYA